MAKKKLTQRNIQGKLTRQRLFETSLELFKKHGYENVTIDDICEKVGVSKGAFYTHFKSKDQVVVESFSDLNKLYEEATKPITQDSSAEKLNAFQRYAMKKVEEIGWKAVRQVYHVETGFHKKKSFLVSKTHSLYKLIDKFVTEGQENGTIRKDKSAAAITAMLLQMYRGLILDWCLNNGSYSLVEAADNLGTFVSSGIRSREK